MIQLVRINRLYLFLGRGGAHVNVSIMRGGDQGTRIVEESGWALIKKLWTGVGVCNNKITTNCKI
jgi:hypothetical protein